MANVRLPAELWREVFVHAAYVPGLLTTQWDYDPDDQPWRGWELGEDVSIHTKRAVVQVCREWRVLGVEFLYEVIQVPRYRAGVDYRQLQGLIDTLRASAIQGESSSSEVTQAEPSLGYGWWIKRIECSPDILRRENETYLTSLLHLVHNLSIFIIRQGEASRTRLQPLLTLLESRFSHSLRRLDIKVHDPKPPHVFMPSIPVVSLDMSLIASPQFDVRPGSPSFMTVISLTFLLPLDLSDYPQSLYFPNLRHLGLLNIRDHDFQSLKTLIVLHDSTLISLYLQSMSVCEELPSLLTLATNLRTLTIDDVDFTYLQQNVPIACSFPGITHMGIISLDQTLSDRFTEIFNHLLDVNMFPSLKLIRLFHQSKPVPFDKRWLDAMEKCAKLGLRLQGSQGQSLEMCEGDALLVGGEKVSSDNETEAA